MIKTMKVMLLPNNKQKSRLFKNASAARFVYNWTLWYQQVNHEFGYSFCEDREVRKRLTYLKKHNPKFSWLDSISNNVSKQAVKDACEAFKRFFTGKSACPKFKSRKKSKPSFFADPYKISFTDTHVILEKISLSRRKNRKILNAVRLSEHGRIPTDAKYLNPRITFDGINWWVSVGIEYADSNDFPQHQGIGIDLGIKDLAICSDSIVYPNINKSMPMKKAKKKLRRLQRRISKKYQKNKKGGRYCKTKNIAKSERQALKLMHRISNIRQSYLHSVTSEIISRKPRFIVMEDLNVSGMMKNKHLAEAIQEQCFYEFKRQIEYKSRWSNIEFVLADRFYPSSKMCCCCGYVKKDLSLSERIYNCPACGNTIDRDYQASVNLMRYKAE